MPVPAVLDVWPNRDGAACVCGCCCPNNPVPEEVPNPPNAGLFWPNAEVPLVPNKLVFAFC